MTARLRRGLLARLRTIRVYEIAAWVAVVAYLQTSGRGGGSIGAGLLIIGLLGLAARLAIAAESVRCDASGLRWRSGFVRHRVAWTDVAAIVIAPRRMRLVWISKWPHVTSMCLSVERTGGRSALWVTPSIWTPVVRQGEFVNAAMLIAPPNWNAGGVDGGPVDGAAG